MATPRSEAGLTLVEMMIVLAVIGVITGVAVLGLGGGDRSMSVEAEAGRLAARLRLAADEAMVTQQPIALNWDERGYGFVTAQAGSRGWRPWPVAVLGERHTLPSGLSLRGEQAGEPMLIGGDGAGAPIRLVVAGRSAAWNVTFDGLNVDAAAAGSL